MSATSPRLVAWCAAVVLATLVATFARLGREAVTRVNEAREGVYARAMIDTGNWILPEVPNHVENGEIVPDKPPLFHWIAATATWARAWASGRAADGRHAVARSFDEASLRIPSAIAGCLTVVAILLLGRRLFGMRAALLAAATLLTSWQFVNQSRYGRVDMCLACCLAWAMLLAGIAFLNGRRMAIVGAGAAAGLAVLSKGPVGILLPLFAFGAWALGRTLREKSAKWLRDAPWLAAIAVFLCVALPWYLAAWRLGGRAFVHSQLQTENLDQFIGANGRMSFFYYAGPWLSDSCPWNLLALLAALDAFRNEHPAARYCATVWIVFLAFFQVSAYKRGAYLLPALPIGALLAGRQLDRWITSWYRARGSARDRIRGPWVVSTAIAGVAGSSAGAFLSRTRWLPDLVGHAIPTTDCALALGSLAATLAALCALAAALRRGLPRRALAAASVAALALYLGVFDTALGMQSDWISSAPLVARIEQAVPAGERVVVKGVGDDPSLLLLYHARDPGRFDVVPAGERLPRRREAAYYLVTEREWARIRSGAERCGSTWKELFRETFHGGGDAFPLVLARRETKGPQEIP